MNDFGYDFELIVHPIWPPGDYLEKRLEEKLKLLHDRNETWWVGGPYGELTAMLLLEVSEHALRECLITNINVLEDLVIDIDDDLWMRLTEKRNQCRNLQAVVKHRLEKNTAKKKTRKTLNKKFKSSSAESEIEEQVVSVSTPEGNSIEINALDNNSEQSLAVKEEPDDDYVENQSYYDNGEEQTITQYLDETTEENFDGLELQTDGLELLPASSMLSQSVNNAYSEIGLLPCCKCGGTSTQIFYGVLCCDSCRVSKMSNKVTHGRKTFREKVLRALCFHNGPVLSSRFIQKHVNGSHIHELIVELNQLQSLGFGAFKKTKIGGGYRKIFYKPAPQNLPESSPFLEMAAISKSHYSEYFFNMENMNAKILGAFLLNHPDIDLLRGHLPSAQGSFS